MKRRVIAFVLSVVMMTGVMSIVGAAQAAPNLAADGVYTTWAPGRNGRIEVITTIENGAIVDIEIGEHLESEVFVYRAIPVIIDRIITYNSVNVDLVAGSTLTTAAIRFAVAEAIVEGGGNLAAYANRPEVTRRPDEEITVDVAVVGGGISGVQAAAAAADNGAQVALIEMTTLLGGASLMSFGTTAIGSGVHHIEYDAQELITTRFNAWIRRELFRVDSQLLLAFLTNTGRAHRVLYEIGYAGPGFAPGSFMLTLPYQVRPAILDEFMEDTVLATGGYLLMEHTATELITDAAGAVTGVITQRADGSTLTVNAGAVVMATGGYAGDAELVYRRSGIRAVPGAIMTTRGEGIQMAWDVGARVPINIHGGIMLHQTLSTADLTGMGFDYFHVRMPMILCYVPSLMRVDHRGIRYFNEGYQNTAVIASNSAAFTGGFTYVLLSQQTVDNLREGGLAAIAFHSLPGMPPEFRPDFTVEDPWPYIDDVLEAMVDTGAGHFAATIEDLARAAGFDPDIFRAQFDLYQDFANAGHDALFNKDPDWLVPYCDGPFWLVQSTYNMLGTAVGLVVNTSMQVLDDNNVPVPGLFAAGNNSSSTLYNNMYTGSGDAMGWAVTSGFLAGEYSAAYVLGR